MTIKVFISGLSGNKEVKKRQQRVLMILDSKSIDYTVIDITEPGKEEDKEFMQQNSKRSDSTAKANPLPPQIFNEDDYCGNYDEFDLANEMDELEKFLKLPLGSLGNGVSNGSPTSPKISIDQEKEYVPIEETESDRDKEQLEESIEKIDEVFELEENGLYDDEPNLSMETNNVKELQEEDSTQQPEE